jgi:hypothetical protein
MEYLGKKTRKKKKTIKNKKNTKEKKDMPYDFEHVDPLQCRLSTRMTRNYGEFALAQIFLVFAILLPSWGAARWALYFMYKVWMDIHVVWR